MPLVVAKCPQCGADLAVDNSKDAAVCPFCGSAYIVEKAINIVNNNVTNNVTNNNNIQTDVVNIVKEEKKYRKLHVAIDESMKPIVSMNYDLSKPEAYKNQHYLETQSISLSLKYTLYIDDKPVDDYSFSGDYQIDNGPHTIQIKGAYSTTVMPVGSKILNINAGDTDVWMIDRIYYSKEDFLKGKSAKEEFKLEVKKNIEEKKSKFKKLAKVLWICEIISIIISIICFALIKSYKTDAEFYARVIFAAIFATISLIVIPSIYNIYKDV